MQWTRIGAIGWILTDEIVFTAFYFLVLPFFNVNLPLAAYIGVMLVLVTKDVIAVKLLWNIVLKKPQIGKESLVEKIGTAYTDFESEGIVQIENEYWKAETTYPVRKGEKVRVLEVNGLFLKIEPFQHAPDE